MADEDLEQLTRNEMIAEVKKLRTGIRRHRDSTGHELCWHHQLWELLPEKVDPDLAVPAWPQVRIIVEAADAVLSEARSTASRLSRQPLARITEKIA